MIGKAIYTIIKNNISEFNTGGVFPVVMPQNANYTTGANSNFPAIIYDTISEFIVSKDNRPNMVKCKLTLQVVSESYKTTAEICDKLKFLLDKYRDLSFGGLEDVKGFTDNKGSKHNFIKNIDICDVFYVDGEDDYLDEWFLYSRTEVYDLYYYYNINRYSYDKGGVITNPLVLSLDATTITIDNKGAFLAKTGTDYTFPANSETLIRWYNSIGSFYAKSNTGNNRELYKSYLTFLNSPVYYNNSLPAYIDISALKMALINNQTTVTPMSIPYGALFIFVYKPTVAEDYNYLSGDVSTLLGINETICISHKKIGSDITIEFNPRGEFSTYSSDTVTLKTSTDSSNYWDADIHFLALSLGGNKAQTGGTKNNSGWYEYFNSNNNPKLSTGQVLNDNSFTGNSNTYSNSLKFVSIGGGGSSAGFKMYEMLLFVPNETTRGTSYDVAPYQPTDIIYNEIKNYIYNKYNSLN